jgi:hypothetical protein
MDICQGVTMDSTKSLTFPSHYPCMPCMRATPETALRPFQGWLDRRAGGLWPSSTPLDSPRRTPMFTDQEKPDTLGCFAFLSGMTQIKSLKTLIRSQLRVCIGPPGIQPRVAVKPAWGWSPIERPAETEGEALARPYLPSQSFRQMIGFRPKCPRM